MNANHDLITEIRSPSRKVYAGRISVLLLSLLFCAAAAPRAQQPPDPWQPVAQALGRSGEEKDGVYRVAFPRSDLRVRIGGVTLRTALALTSWAAFQKMDNATMVMGDLVLLATEVSPVVSKLAESNIDVMAIHNHLLGEQPRVMYVHYHGHGDAAQLAAALRSALALTGTPLTTPRPRRTRPETLDVDGLSKILGRPGTAHSGVVSFSFPREETISGGGAILVPRMGVATSVNFQQEGSGAVTTGDFVLLEEEIQPVIRALREHDIEVAALHNHLLDEQPRLFFLHFWGRGTTETLAQGIRAALDQTNCAK